MKNAVVSGIAQIVGSLMAVGVFWLGAWLYGWEIPNWAWWLIAVQGTRAGIKV